MLRTIAKKFTYFHIHTRRLELEMVKGQLADADNILLDGGCGDGTFSASLGKKVVGIDIDPIEVRRASGLLYGVVGDLSAMPFRDGVFPSILSNSVMEHVPKLREAMREYGRIGRPGAKLVLTVPTDTEAMWLRRFTRILYNVFHNLSIAEWEELVEDSGFRVTVVQSYHLKVLHNIYMIACVFYPLLILSIIFVFLLKGKRTGGVHLCLVSEKR